MRTPNRPFLHALLATLVASSTTTAGAVSARDEILAELRINCSLGVDEILKRDFRIELGQDIDRRKFCACADEKFQLDPWLDRIVSMPAAERQRPSKAWLYLDRAYFLAGLDCIGPLPGGEEKVGRSIGEVMAVLDRHKALFYGAYRQALKRQPDLRGKVLVDFTIASSGKIKQLRMTPSDFGGVEFVRNLEALFRALDFGVNDVPEQAIKFPIDFLPE